MNNTFYSPQKDKEPTVKLKRIATVIVSVGFVFTASAQAEQHNSKNSKRNLSTHKLNTAAQAANSSDMSNSDNDHAVRNIINNIHFNGFLSAGFAKTNSDARYDIPGHGQVSNNFAFAPMSLAGIQASANINKNLSAVMQLVANGDDTNGHSAYQVNVEWAYLRYRALKDLNLYAGRFRLPLFLYSDTLEVGYNYVWTFLPSEVYRVVPFYNINGVQAVYSTSLGGNWTMSFQPFFGQNKSQYDEYYMQRHALASDGPDKITTDFDENNLTGAVIAFSNPYVTLRGTYGQTSLSATFNVPVDDVPVEPFKNERVSFYTLGAKVDYRHFVAAAEYAHRSSTKTNDIAALSGYYGMVGYQFGKFLPNFTYAKLKTDNAKALETALKKNQIEDQKSMTLGLDYYINTHVVVKAAVARITPQNGTAGLFDYKPNSKVSMYSVGVNATF